MFELQLECDGRQHDLASHSKTVKQRNNKGNVLINFFLKITRQYFYFLGVFLIPCPLYAGMTKRS